MIFNNRFLIIFLLPLYWATAFGFTEYLLKTCQQSGFCHRNKVYSQNILKTKNSYYSIDLSSINYEVEKSKSELNLFTANIIKTIPRPDVGDIKVVLPISISFLKDTNSVRLTIDEDRHPELDNSISEILNPYRYNETWKWAFDIDNKDILQGDKLSFYELKGSSNNVISLYNRDNSIKVEVYTNSFKIKVFYNDTLVFTVNDRLFMNLEHKRLKELNFQNINPEETPYNMFGDDFEYSKDDTLKFGPESVALDFTFNNMENVYGIPEHADSLKLKDTSNTEPYRLFNVDVFEYTIDSPMPMYGAIPFMIGTNKDTSAGIFWVNAADTWVDIAYEGSDTKTHWISETGIIDVVLFLGKSPSDLTKNYIKLTGKPQLPLLSSIGYHQCRWNYNDEPDVLNVDSEMDKYQFPFDFIWLDLEYTDDKKYFTWKPNSFPNPKRLLNKLARLGRQLVVLIDPHLKLNYFVSDSVVEDQGCVYNSEGDPFIGHCWPGNSIWIDTLNPIGQKLWDGFFKKFIGSIKNLHIWNDMNEPSIFSGPETTAPKDLIHYAGFEERSIHNIYGLSVHETTYDSLKEIKDGSGLRPFVLTRAFFAGSQRTAATWTGDNAANWDYLRISIPMCLTNNIVGMPFIGADVAGFSGDPEPELLVRWYQAGIWYPFFRGHAHIDTKRREPYLLDEPDRSIVREAIQLRYALLPMLYTSFFNAHRTGTPIMKPMFYDKTMYPELYAIDDQFYVGDSGLLVKPIVDKEATSVEMMFVPGIYYEYTNLSPLIINGIVPQSRNIDAPLDIIPMFIEGGHILTRRNKYRRSSKLMRHDPYTLVIAPDVYGNAFGDLYIDDGETFEFEKGEYLETNFSLNDGKVLKSTVLNEPQFDNVLGNTDIYEIKIATAAIKKTVKKTVTIISGSNKHEVPLHRSEDGNWVSIRYPKIKVDETWEITF
ncbi:hypothetical protein Kpol_534p42 [Vanderwaltozyma polyspora DSM 70294]|uniref:Glucosidase II subunit alpha n=1 Tax=Vanderwaltozyma polyspora (strain ATCC 22028 / DSM 70294 / BCRC 21397 / CBS 2163 / NBRC 10782 / NRRL Y-8283 / UCD 57-17) TaxID=436907 RepID=A7TJL8_VANPO|nr:uncharacterized protein Kpol_534p42 [Vanderwaltozyma polyspora DSM 70294]EDO17561.1 hypothetical protein Kpol_534p42 [Vanderwaltozyma polyspora DSM 70294]